MAARGSKKVVLASAKKGGIRGAWVNQKKANKPWLPQDRVRKGREEKKELKKKAILWGPPGNEDHFNLTAQRGRRQKNPGGQTRIEADRESARTPTPRGLKKVFRHKVGGFKQDRKPCSGKKNQKKWGGGSQITFVLSFSSATKRLRREGTAREKDEGTCCWGFLPMNVKNLKRGEKGVGFQQSTET